LNKRYEQQQNQGKEKDVLLNEEIRAKEVRCMTDAGEQLGIIPLYKALEKANRLGLDLVLIAATANPPVCKIMDYGKFRYQREKKKKEARKKQKIIDVKEIKLSVKIAQNDINYKVKHAREFLEAEKHVKFRVFLRGREMSDPQAGVKVLEGVWKMVEDIGEMDKEPKQEGRYINMLVIPKGSVKK
jgi:translation initiation factor IF-3